MEKLLVLAFLCETLWETLKLTIQGAEKKISIDRIGAIAMGLMMAFATGFNVFSYLEIEIAVPWLGLVLTGLLFSRGANFLHDLLKIIYNFMNGAKG